MLFHWTTKCQEDIPTGENFLPPIKTRSPLVKAVDGLQAGKITFKDYHLIRWTKVGFKKAVKEDFFLAASSSVHSILMIQCV